MPAREADGVEAPSSAAPEAPRRPSRFTREQSARGGRTTAARRNGTEHPDDAEDRIAREIMRGGPREPTYREEQDNWRREARALGENPTEAEVEAVIGGWDAGQIGMLQRAREEVGLPRLRTDRESIATRRRDGADRSIRDEVAGTRAGAARGKLLEQLSDADLDNVERDAERENRDRGRGSNAPRDRAKRSAYEKRERIIRDVRNERERRAAAAPDTGSGDPLDVERQMIADADGKVTDDDRALIGAFAGQAFAHMNAASRGSYDPREFHRDRTFMSPAERAMVGDEASARATAQRADEVIHKFRTPAPVTVTRVVDGGDYLGDLTPGGEITNRGIVSTTMGDTDFEGDTLFRINVPEGFPAASLEAIMAQPGVRRSAVQSGGHELFLPDGTRFRVRSVSTREQEYQYRSGGNGTQRVVEVDALPPGNDDEEDGPSANSPETGSSASPTTSSSPTPTSSTPTTSGATSTTPTATDYAPPAPRWRDRTSSYDEVVEKLRASAPVDTSKPGPTPLLAGLQAAVADGRTRYTDGPFPPPRGVKLSLLDEPPASGPYVETRPDGRIVRHDGDGGTSEFEERMVAGFADTVLKADDVIDPVRGMNSEQLDRAWQSSGVALTDDQQRALRSYVDGSFSSINGALRGNQEPRPDVRDTIDGLDDAMAQWRLPSPTIVHRGVRTTGRDGRQSFPAENLAGKMLVDPGYLSTSPNERIVDRFDGPARLEIHLPAGTPAVAVNGAGITVGNADERELLLPRGLRLRVVSDGPDADGKRRIVAHAEPDEVPADELADDLVRVGEATRTTDRYVPGAPDRLDRIREMTGRERGAAIRDLDDAGLSELMGRVARDTGHPNRQGLIGAINRENTRRMDARLAEAEAERARVAEAAVAERRQADAEFAARVGGMEDINPGSNNGAAFLAAALQRATRTGRSHFVVADKRSGGRLRVRDRMPTSSGGIVGDTMIEIRSDGSMWNHRRSMLGGGFEPNPGQGVPGSIVDKTSTFVEHHAQRAARNAAEPDPYRPTTMDGGPSPIDHVDTAGLNNGARAAAHRSLQAIARVHRVEGMNRIVASMEEGVDHGGGFTPGGQLIPHDRISLTSDAPANALDFTHEYGHAVDRHGLVAPATPLYGTGMLSIATPDAPVRDREDTKALARALDVIKASPTFARGMAQRKRTKAYVDYWQADHELWARAYAQFIATRSGDEALMRDLRYYQGIAERNANDIPIAWTDEEFAPIDAAVADVLRARGWMD